MKSKLTSHFIKCIKRVSAPFRSSVAILLYHRVSSELPDVQQLCVTPEIFAKQLGYVSKHYKVMSLAELNDAINRKELPKRAVVVTFDDGYADNLYNARPILERYSIPATFFVSSGYVKCEREFWWDAFEQILLRPGALPEHLSMMIGEQLVDHHLAGDREYTEKDANRFKSWSVIEKRDPTRRHKLYRVLCDQARNLGFQEREQFIDRLECWSGGSLGVRPGFKTLSSKEVHELSGHSLFEIGAHTVTHSSLSALSIESQSHEIINGKRELENIIGKTITSLSYPYGSLPDFTNDSVRITREIGFSCACANYPSAVHCTSDVFRLPRFVVRNWNESEFASRLKGFFLS